MYLLISVGTSNGNQSTPVPLDKYNSIAYLAQDP